MPRISKKEAFARTEQIKRLIYTGQPFESALAQLYTCLRLQGRHVWNIEIYRMLLLCLPPRQHVRLYHPALLQAFISTEDLPQARRIAAYLSIHLPQDPETKKLCLSLQMQQENALPPYTPLANVSKYAAPPEPGQACKSTDGCLPEAWQQALRQFTPARLQQLGYYQKQAQLAQAPKAFRTSLQRDFEELTVNYLFQNRRAVIVLAGAVLESLLMMHLYSKCGLKQITLPGKPTRKIFECNLHDLLAYCTRQKLLPEQLLRLSRAARLQRNFIHPGKERTENTTIRPAGVRLCWLAVLELTDALLPLRKK